MKSTNDFLFEVFDKSRNSPLDYQQIRQQLQKNSDSNYTITDITADFDDIFLAKSQLNTLRRAVLQKLTYHILEEYNKQFVDRSTIASQIDNVPLTTAPDLVSAIFYDKQQLISNFHNADIAIYKPEFINDDSLCGIDIDKYPYLSLCQVSTHDQATSYGFWLNEEHDLPDRLQRKPDIHRNILPHLKNHRWGSDGMLLVINSWCNQSLRLPGKLHREPG